MPHLRDLPELGVGFIYWPGLEELISPDDPSVDVLEVEPQSYWFAPTSTAGAYELDPRAFDHLRRLPRPKLMHGVGSPVGGTVAPGTRQVEAFVESIRRLDAPWASEHLSFNRVRRDQNDVDVGFLLPPVQSRQGVEVAAANIAALKERLPVPLSFETGVSYLRPLPGELSDGQFFASVALEADCGILLDLHNLWANEKNGRQPVLDVVEELPLERVVEVHLAGGQLYDGYWVDAHSGLIPAAVIELARLVVPRLPNLKAMIFEIMPEYAKQQAITREQLASQFEVMHSLWRQRATNLRTNPRRSLAHTNGKTLPSPRAWEEALSTAVTGSGTAQEGWARDLSMDPGIGVLRRLISAVRAGKVADTLTMTTRLLLLSLGEAGLQEVFDEFWVSFPSEQMASDEAHNFAAYITELQPRTAGIPYLRDVVSFELAAHQAVITGVEQHVGLTVDPEPLLSALRKGRLPPALQSGVYEALVTPP